MAHSLVDFAAHLGRAAVLVHETEHEALEHIGKVVEAEAHAIPGVYQDGWQSLAEATKKDREAHGYPADEPLLRSGQLRDSYGHKVVGDAVYIGSDRPEALWMETGTKNMPPRSVLVTATIKKKAEIEEAGAKAIGKALAVALR